MLFIVGLTLIVSMLLLIACQAMAEMFAESVAGEDAMFRVHAIGFKILGLVCPVLFASGVIVLGISVFQH